MTDEQPHLEWVSASDREEADEAISMALRRFPNTLGAHGFRLDEDEVLTPFDGFEPQVMTAIEYLRQCDKTKTMGHGLYNLRMEIRRWNRAFHRGHDLTLGAVVAAALWNGFRVVREGQSGCALLDVSKRSCRLMYEVAWLYRNGGSYGANRPYDTYRGRRLLYQNW